MTIGNAKKFFKRVRTDSQLRDMLTMAETNDQRLEILKKEELTFNEYELEDGFTNSLINCQFEEEADILQQLYQWWKMLNS